MLIFSFHADALIGYVQQCTTTTTLFEVVYVFGACVCVVCRSQAWEDGGGSGIKRNKKAKRKPKFFPSHLNQHTLCTLSNPNCPTTYSYPPP